MTVEEVQLWNMVQAIATQALLGSITPSVRRICLGRSAEKWQVLIECSQIRAQEMDEFEDLRTEFEALEIDSIEFELDVRINKGALDWSKGSCVRALYLKHRDWPIE
jgi:hypothetical protein